MTFSNETSNIYYIYKVNSCPDKTPNIRGNRTTNEEVKYICCLKRFLESEFQRSTNGNHRERSLYINMSICLFIRRGFRYKLTKHRI